MLTPTELEQIIAACIQATLQNADNKELCAAAVERALKANQETAQSLRHSAKFDRETADMLRGKLAEIHSATEAPSAKKGLAAISDRLRGKRLN